MEITKENYILSRNIIRGQNKRKSVLDFIKFHKIAISISIIFLSLIIVEGLLLNQFIKLLEML